MWAFFFLTYFLQPLFPIAINICLNQCIFSCRYSNDILSTWSCYNCAFLHCLCFPNAFCRSSIASRISLVSQLFGLLFHLKKGVASLSWFLLLLRLEPHYIPTLCFAIHQALSRFLWLYLLFVQRSNFEWPFFAPFSLSQLHNRVTP